MNATVTILTSLKSSRVREMNQIILNMYLPTSNIQFTSLGQFCLFDKQHDSA